MIPDFDNDERIPVILQSDQFIVKPVQISKTVVGDSKEFQVDLTLQSCQCNDFVQYRIKMPIGDPRRFCRHMVPVQAEFPDDLHPFVQSLFEVRELSDQGMPNGASCAFFEIEGRLAFVGENRDRTTYFFVTGRGSTFHEFIYDRSTKNWVGGKPDDPAPLLKFAFHSRNQYGEQFQPANTNSTSKGNPKQKRRTPQPSSDSNLVRYLLLAMVVIALAAGGFYYLNNREQVDAFVQSKLGQDPLAEKTASKNSTDLPATDSLSKSTATEKKNPPDSTAKLVEKQPKPTDLTKTTPRETQVLASESAERVKLPEYRDWKYADDSFFVSARYKSYQNGNITLVRQDDQTEIKIDKSKLSEEDQAYIKAILRERRLQKAREKRRN